MIVVKERDKSIGGRVLIPEPSNTTKEGIARDHGRLVLMFEFKTRGRSVLCSENETWSKTEKLGSENCMNRFYKE